MICSVTRIFPATSPGIQLEECAYVPSFYGPERRRVILILEYTKVLPNPVLAIKKRFLEIAVQDTDVKPNDYKIDFNWI